MTYDAARSGVPNFLRLRLQKDVGKKALRKEVTFQIR